MGKGDRPEHAAPPELFYNDDEAVKYTASSRVMEIQEKLTLRALELLALPDDGTPKFILDVGCGSGLSGEVLTEEGHFWVGMDIAPAMLEVALEKEVDGDLMLHDMGDGLPFRPGAFDGVVSISAVQWLCNADKSHHVPRKRMRRFFRSLYNCLTKGGRAALQIYPENVEQATMLSEEAMKVGFSGGLVVDYPHSTRAKKYYLCLMVGAAAALPAALTAGEAAREVGVAGRERSGKRRKVDGGGKGKEWVLKKKAQMRGKGYVGIAADSKYTGRKRKDRF